MITFKEYVAEENTLLASIPAFKTFMRRRDELKPEEKKSLLHQGYEEIMPRLKAIESKLKGLITSNIPSKGMPVRPTILTGIKPEASIISKVVKRGKDIAKVADLVRGAVLFLNAEEVMAFIRTLMKKAANFVVKHEEKKRGGDKTYGYYGSHHIDLFIDGITVELQVMTKKLWAMKSNAHDIYNNTRENPFGPSSGDKHLSKKIFDMGNKPAYQREEISELMEFGEFSKGLVEHQLDS